MCESENILRLELSIFRWFVGNFDRVLQYRDRKTLVRHGAQEESKVFVYGSIRGSKTFDDSFHT